MKERIKGAFTKKKIFHFLKMALFVVALSLILLSLLGTVAHATGLVDDTINAENLYSKYPLSNYQLDFYVEKHAISIASEDFDICVLNGDYYKGEYGVVTETDMSLLMI